MLSPLAQFFQQHATKPLDSRLLYYELPAWIRFDLQGNLSPHDTGYYAQVLHRAMALFEAAFAPTDEVLLVYQEHRCKRHRIRSNSYLFQQLGIGKRNVTFRNRRAIPSSQSYHVGRWSEVFYSITAAQVSHRALLAAISYQVRYQGSSDQNRPAIHGLLYFFNRTRGLIFYMYDDRGILVSSNSTKPTRPLYQEYNDWILNYDREIIDALFAENSPRNP